jgi:hypothetical protein
MAATAGGAAAAAARSRAETPTLSELKAPAPGVDQPPNAAFPK